MSVNENLLADVSHIATQAGEKIMQIYNAPDFQARIATQAKTDDSPLTQADLAAHRHIAEALQNLRHEHAELPQLSEESEHIPWQQRQNWESYWLIDPLDGTKEFIKRNGEFTVNIALIHKGLPLLGCVYAPALKTLYSGAFGVGSYKNQEAIQARQTNPEKLRVVGSRSHPSPELSDYLTNLKRPYELVEMGSSLKLCLIAESAADLYPRLGPTSEWDTAAAHAIVSAAGGSVEQLNGQPLRYNQSESLLNPHFVAR